MRKIKKKNTTTFYDIQEIKSLGCQYNIIIGQRSNGKSYAALEDGLKVYWSTGGEIAIIRRWDEDFKGKRGASCFEGLVANNVIEEVTGGEWTNVFYRSGRWFLCRYDEEGNRIVAEKPFCYAFSITAMEHDKSSSYPNIITVIFDEFLTRTAYLPDEFVKFMNVLSTIIRYRDNVTVYMLGNTVNQYCPYFDEMGLYRIREMEPGDIDVYGFGESGLKVAVEYCGQTSITKRSSKYFAFNNPKLKMITGGMWELAVYPHLPVKYRPKDVVFTYIIRFGEELLQAEIISVEGGVFTYIHRKTTPIKDEDTDIVFCPEQSYKPNWFRRLSKGRTPIEKKIYEFFVREKVFYQDNTVGEIVRNYLLWCNSPLIQA